MSLLERGLPKGRTAIIKHLMDLIVGIRDGSIGLVECSVSPKIETVDAVDYNLTTWGYGYDPGRKRREVVVSKHAVYEITVEFGGKSLPEPAPKPKRKPKPKAPPKPKLPPGSRELIMDDD